MDRRGSSNDSRRTRSRRNDSRRTRSRRNDSRRTRKRSDRRPNGNRCYNNSGSVVDCEKQDSADRRRPANSSDRKKQSGSKNPSKSRRDDEDEGDCERRCAHAGRSPARCRQKCGKSAVEILDLFYATGGFTALPDESSESADNATE